MGTNILIVDDEKRWRSTLSELLRNEDYKPNLITAKSYQDAQTKLREMLFSVATLDMRLEDWDNENSQGIQLLEHINKQRDGTQVVMVTGHSTEELRKVAVVNLEAFYFIEKDKLDPDQFRELIKEAIEKCEESDERKILLRETGLGPYEKDTIQRAAKELTINKMPFIGNKPDKKKFKEEIRTIGAMMINILRPLLNKPAGLEFVDLGDGHRQMVGRYWSRAEGKAITVVIRDSKIDQDPQIDGIFLKTKELDHLRGFVYEHDISFDEFLNK